MKVHVTMKTYWFVQTVSKTTGLRLYITFRQYLQYHFLFFGTTSSKFCKKAAITVGSSILTYVTKSSQTVWRKDFLCTYLGLRHIELLFFYRILNRTETKNGKKKRKLSEVSQQELPKAVLKKRRLISYKNVLGKLQILEYVWIKQDSTVQFYFLHDHFRYFPDHQQFLNLSKDA